MDRGQFSPLPFRAFRNAQITLPAAQKLRTYAALILLLLAIALLLAPIWQPGYPWGSDTWGHLQRAHYMGEIIREHGIVDGFLQSAWMPSWYLGDPTRVYYPPFVLWLLGPLTALTHDVFIAYRIFVSVVFFVLGLSVYKIGMLWGGNRWLALSGALLAVGAPYTLRTVFSEGNLARSAVIVFLPWIFWYSEQLIMQKTMRRPFVLLTVMWALSFVAHPMQTAIFVVVTVVFIALRLLGDVFIPLRRGFFALLSAALGGLLAAFYLLPAYSHLELANVPHLSADKIDIFSVTLDALLPYHISIEAVSVGLLTTLLALVIAIYSKDPRVRTFVLSSAICIVLAFGPSGLLFEFLPFKQSLLPERFLNASAILLPLSIATAPLKIQPRWIILALMLIGVVEFSPAFRVVQMRAAPPDELAIAHTLAESPLAGRVAPLTFPNPTASQIFLTNVMGKHDNTSGWALENTPHQEAVSRLLYAMEHSPEYLQRIFSLWNVDYLLTRSQEPVIDSHLTYQLHDTFGTLHLWQRETPSAFVHTLPRNRMLIIGENPTSWLMAFPFASEGEWGNPARYDRKYLENYSVIGINRASQNSDIEGVLEDWVSRGNTLIMDLSGLGSLYEQGYSVFGVHALPIALTRQPLLSTVPELSDLTSAVQFPFTEGAWTGTSYYGLDETLAVVIDDGHEYPLIGYRTIGKGRVWFIGFNLFYLLDLTKQHEAKAALVDYLLAGVEVDRTYDLPTLPVEMLQEKSNHIEFRYNSAEPVNAVLSMTYFPRWRAAINDQPLALLSHERLIRLELPSGEYTITLSYETYGSASWVGLAVSVAAGGMVAGLFRVLKAERVLSRSERESNFSDRLPQEQEYVAPKLKVHYDTCPICHYPNAIVGPPTRETYPFFNIHCPDCGLKLDNLLGD